MLAIRYFCNSRIKVPDIRSRIRDGILQPFMLATLMARSNEKFLKASTFVLKQFRKLGFKYGGFQEAKWYRKMDAVYEVIRSLECLSIRIS